MAPQGGEEVRRGRLAKAIQFQKVAQESMELADEGSEVADAVATLAVHAGIAAADAICTAALGEYHQGQNHVGAVALLKKVDKDLSNQLDRLLKVKTRAGYGYETVSAAQLEQALRSMDKLVEAARERA